MLSNVYIQKNDNKKKYWETEEHKSESIPRFAGLRRDELTL